MSAIRDIPNLVSSTAEMTITADKNMPAHGDQTNEPKPNVQHRDTKSWIEQIEETPDTKNLIKLYKTIADLPGRAMLLESIEKYLDTSGEPEGEELRSTKRMSILEQGLPSIPDSNDLKLDLLDDLVGCYEKQFKRLKQSEDLDKIIEYQQQIVRLSLHDNVKKSARLSDLGGSYYTRFQRLDDLADINKSITYKTQALFLTPDTHKDKPGDLNNLATSHMSRFQYLGQLADIESAIEYGEKAVALTPDEHANKPAHLSNLGVFHITRFQRLGKLQDMDKAIMYTSRAVALTPDGDGDKPARLNNLGGTYQGRFRYLGQLSDIERAIECHKEAVLLAQDSDQGKPACLNQLAVSYVGRFQYLGELSDIEMAIKYGEESVLNTPEGDPSKRGRLGNLGSLWNTRFQHSGNIKDVDMAIRYQNQATLLTPDGHADKSGQLNNLGNSYEARFGHTGELSDLENAIDCKNRAVLLTPDGHPNKPSYLNNLGNSYWNRFEHLDEPADIEKAILYHSEAVLKTPDAHPDKAARLSNLGMSYKRRFQRQGNLDDLEKAIEFYNRAMMLTPTGHTDKPARLSHLGAAYTSRFERLASLPDIDQAISYINEAVMLTPDNHVDKPGWFHNLGNAYECRFQHLGELTDIDKAIAFHLDAVALNTTRQSFKPTGLRALGRAYISRFRRLGRLKDNDSAILHINHAVLLAPDSHSEKPALLSNLGNSYESRFEHTDELEDIARAIEYHGRAVNLTPDGHPEKPAWLSNLGGSHEIRFQHTGESVDSDRALEYKIQAADLTPDDHPDKSARLSNLGISYETRFRRLGNPEDIDSAIRYFKSAALSSSGNSSNRFRASRSWATLAAHHQTFSPIEAYTQAISLIPQVAWLGATVGRRYESLASDIRDTAVEAAAVAISLGRYELALEWLETGRSVVWNQTLQLRSPLDDLSAVDRALADKLVKISEELEHVSSMNSVNSAGLENKQSLEQTAQHHRRLAEEWDRLVNQARLLPNLKDFLKPHKASQLVDTTKTGAVVVLNVDPSRCDALILQPGSSSIAHIPLVGLSHKKAQDAGIQLEESLRRQGLIQRGFKAGRAESRLNDTFEKVLIMLWNDVAKPILEHLGYMQNKPPIDLPRITWCATGALSFLPLHAAGDYGSPCLILSNLAVSSYTPTLGALHSSSQCRSRFTGILAIGQASTPGLSPLPGAAIELDIIEKQAGSLKISRMENEGATPTTVLNQMEHYSWVHFACHASQNPKEPTKSAFHLHGGGLDLNSITKRPLKNAQLAFLSACQTATGDEKLPEEAVHLAAGMLMAGFPSVIATMWSINDKDAPLIAENVYGCMLEGGVADSGKAAKALNAAVRCLQEKIGVKEFGRWVPYVHFGH